MKFLKYVLAILFGAFGGLFLYLDLAMILFREPPAWFVMATFFGGWILITRWLLKETDGVSEMLGRSFVISAILSFGFSPAVLILSAKTVDVSGSGAQAAGSVIGGGLVSSVGIAVSLFLTFVSLVGYGLVKLYRKESGSRGGRMMDCFFCSEPVKATAKKCRHCGEFLDRGSRGGEKGALSTEAAEG